MREPREVVDDYLRFLEKHELAALDDVVAEHLVVYKPNGEIAFDNRAAWKAAVSEEPFADTKLTVEEIVCEGEKVAVRYRLVCVQVRPAFGVFPSGRRIETSGTKIYRVRDGKIIEIAGHDDVLGVLRQLGLVEIDI